MGKLSIDRTDHEYFGEASMNDNCSICREVGGETGTRLSWALQDDALQNAVLAASRTFAIIPSVGPLVVGHSLLVTRHHRCSIFGEIASRQLREIEFLLDEFWPFALRLDDIMPGLLCFEHGAPGNLESKLCSTTHAHLHIVPLFGNKCDVVLESLDGKPLELIDAHALQIALQGLKEYVLAFHVTRGGKLRHAKVIDAKNLPSQYMRLVVARQLGIDAWDWKAHPNSVLLRKTISLGFRLNCNVNERSENYKFSDLVTT